MRLVSVLYLSFVVIKNMGAKVLLFFEIRNSRLRKIYSLHFLNLIHAMPALPLMTKNTTKSTIEKRLPIKTYSTTPAKAYNAHHIQASIFW